MTSVFVPQYCQLSRLQCVPVQLRAAYQDAVAGLQSRAAAEMTSDRYYRVKAECEFPYIGEASCNNLLTVTLLTCKYFMMSNDANASASATLSAGRGSHVRDGAGSRIAARLRWMAGWK